MFSSLTKIQILKSVKLFYITETSDHTLHPSGEKKKKKGFQRAEHQMALLGVNTNM